MLKPLIIEYWRLVICFRRQLVDELSHATVVIAFPVNFLTFTALPIFFVVRLGLRHEVLFNCGFTDSLNVTVAVYASRERPQ